MKGLINLNKPTGISSAAAVSKVRRFLGVKAVGHMGTLDPLASGVLLIGVGKACRLFDFFLKKDKRYTAVFDFGCDTDTLDSTGTYLSQGGYIPSLEEINGVLSSFKGKISQVPPQYSAKSVNGQRAYKIARGGGSVELTPAEVEIHNISVIEKVSASSFSFEIHCSSGTYIRSLARDIGAKLGTHAIMSALIRTTCGKFSLEDACSLEELESKGQECLIPLDEILSDLPRLNLEQKYHKLLDNGVKIPSEGDHQLTNSKGEIISFTNQPFTIYANGQLYGIANKDNSGFIKITTYLKE